MPRSRIAFLVAPGGKIDRDHVGHQRDIGVDFGGVLQRHLDGVAGRVVDMDDAAVAVPALARQVQRVAVHVERHAQLCQPGDRARCAFDHHFDDRAVVQACAGDHRILDMAFEGVAGLEHRGDPALRPIG